MQEGGIGEVIFEFGVKGRLGVWQIEKVGGGIPGIRHTMDKDVTSDVRAEQGQRRRACRRDGSRCGQAMESTPRSSVYRLLILSFFVFVLKKNGMIASES